jgi:hypothetical protein
VRPSPSLSSYPLYFSPEQLTNHLAWSNSPQIDAIVHYPKLITASTPPVASLFRIWKQSTTPIKRTRSP